MTGYLVTPVIRARPRAYADIQSMCHHPSPRPLASCESEGNARITPLMRGAAYGVPENLKFGIFFNPELGAHRMDVSRWTPPQIEKIQHPGLAADPPLPHPYQSAILCEFVACWPLPCRSDPPRAAGCTGATASQNLIFGQCPEVQDTAEFRAFGVPRAVVGSAAGSVRRL